MTNNEIRKLLNEFKKQTIAYMQKIGYRDNEGYDNNKWFDRTYFYKQGYFMVELLIMYHDDDQIISLRCGDGDLTLHAYAEYLLRLRDHDGISEVELKTLLNKMLVEFMETFGDIRNNEVITKSF